MGAILKSWAAILVSVGALAVVILGVQLLLPISGLDYPREWVGFIIVGVVGGTTALAGAVYWLSDTIAA